MVDYRKFLAKKEELVLPYLGGTSVETRDRHFRVDVRPVPGWYRCTIMGRNATVGAAAEAAVDGLPRLRGHLHRGWLFAPSASPEEVLLLPEDEAPAFQTITAHRWHGGEALFEALDFDGDAEDAVRRALDDGTSLKDVKGVTPPLRTAFAWELVRRVANAEDEHVGPKEVARFALDVAESGVPEAKRVFEEIIRLRRGGRIVVAAGERVYAREVIAAARRARKDATWENVEERAEDALHAARARLLGVRRLVDLVEVRFRFD
ncbi:hypothetical protein BH09MYX1_BH09MYX1_46060 [soil metagenome]